MATAPILLWGHGILGIGIGIRILYSCIARDLSLTVTTASALDYGNDGMSDVWQRLYAAEGVAPDADDDGDGQSNLQESLAGTDPFDALDTLAARIEADSGFGLLIKWDATLGKAYAVETSIGLDEWEPDPGLRPHPEPEQEFLSPYDTETGTFQRDPKEESSEAAVCDTVPDRMKFYRVRLITGGFGSLDTDPWEAWVLGTQFGSEDPDADGLTNAEEYAIGSSPFNPDTDGGGLMDGYEVATGSDPTKPDAAERRQNTSPVGLVVYSPGL